MLKHIPPVLSPALLKVLAEMGHGDTLVLADANFPAESTAKGARIVRCDGLGIPVLLDAILQLFPLDAYIAQPVTLMESEPGNMESVAIWKDYASIISRYEKIVPNGIRYMERFAFYDECRKAYAVVATGERELYANMILQKGVI